jgi:hypothetical protein
VSLVFVCGTMVFVCSLVRCVRMWYNGVSMWSRQSGPLVVWSVSVRWYLLALALVFVCLVLYSVVWFSDIVALSGSLI